jgi:hypothetical protein
MFRDSSILRRSAAMSGLWLSLENREGVRFLKLE